MTTRGSLLAVLVLLTPIAQFLPIAAGLAYLSLSMLGGLVALSFVDRRVRVIAALGSLPFVTVAWLAIHSRPGNASAVGFIAHSAVVIFVLIAYPWMRGGNRSDPLVAGAVFATCCMNVIAVIFGVRTFDVTNHLAENYADGVGGVRASGLYSSPNELGLASALLLIVGLIAIARSESSRVVLLLWIGTVGLSLYLIFAAQARSSMVALLIVGGLWISTSVLRRPGFLPITLLAGAAAAMYFVTQVPIFLGDRELLGRDRAGSADFRASVRETIWRNLTSELPPIIGSGLRPGNSLNASDLAPGISNIDNSFFYTIIVYGLLGALVMVGVIGFGLAYSFFYQRWRFFPLALFACVCYFENAIAWKSALAAIIVAAVIGGSDDEDIGAQQHAVSIGHGEHEPATSGARG